MERVQPRCLLAAGARRRGAPSHGGGAATWGAGGRRRGGGTARAGDLRARFAGDQTGSLTIFGVFVFLVILLVGGLAIDVIRHESRRVHLQHTADRAALAAGSLRQANDPETIVREYFAREGLSAELADVSVSEGLNFRRVEVRTRSATPTLFLKFFGIDHLSSRPASVAEERYSKVEVSLVLDLSNSMNQFNRIQNLRVAGADFIDALFENAEPGQISVSIVPYTGQVNAGAALLDRYDVSPRVPYSHCVEFEAEDYATMGLSPAAPLRGAGHFDPWYFAASPTMFFCPTRPGDHAEIMPFSGDRAALRTRMAQLTADGNTSIEIGLKWGAILLDPGTRPVIDGLVAQGRVPGAFSGRPLAYDDPDVLKVVVLMTDGENFEQWRMADAVKAGPSPVWLNPEDNQLSIHHGPPGERDGYTVPDDYYVPHLGTWQDRPWGAPSPTDFGAVRRLDYSELWARHGVRWVAWTLYGEALGEDLAQRNAILDQRMKAWLSRLPAPEKNVRLYQMCDTIKARDIAIFAVAFEAPPGGVDAMRRCASSPSHFFDVKGTDIRQAFRAIAGTIHHLRLTQ